MKIKKSHNDLYVIKANYFSFNEKDFPFVIKYIGKDFDMKDICLTYLKYIYEK
jgi:hypothetical protein